MTLQFKFTNIDNKDEFIKLINKHIKKNNLHYIITDYSLIVNIDKSSPFTYNELLYMMNEYQDIENLLL